MKKLIVKSRLQSKDLFESRLTSIGQKMSPVIWQHERVYLPRDYQADQNLPRLVTRTEVQDPEQKATYSFYLKRHIEDSGVDWVNFSNIESYTEVTGIIHQLGFRKTAEISRQRRELWLDEHTVIYLDDVEGLAGSFLKLEATIENDESVDALRGDLFRILKMFGQTTFLMQSYFRLFTNEAEEYLIPE